MARESLRVRRATLDDIPAIVAAYCTDVPDGNPWLELPTCAAHLNNFLLDGHTALVGELGGRVVGEAEFFLADEAPFGRLASLNTICVHRSFHRRGVGRALMEEVFRLSRLSGARVCHVTPSPGAVAFYRRLGFETLDHLQWCECSLPRTVRPVRSTACGEEPYEAVSKLVNVFGRYISSRHTWWLSSRWSQVGGEGAPGYPLRFRLPVHGSGAYVALRARGGGRVFGYGWLPPTGSARVLFDRLCRLARTHGFRTLSTIASGALAATLVARLGVKATGAELLLVKSL
jgi:GNAT superfamily N-acetyltransferase